MRAMATPPVYPWGHAAVGLVFRPKAQNVDANTWVFEMERPVSGSVEFKILLNDEAWESGNNHIVQVGNTIEVTPDFS